MIPNDALRLEDLPPPNADWPAIWRLADSFNGYKHWGSFQKCSEIANQQSDSTLTEVRTCLFFECRRWHHYGDQPDEEDSPHLRGLVEKIRAMVVEGRLD